MTEQKIPTKWNLIAILLEELNAPKKVINAAIEIDNALENLGLGDNTQDWEKNYDRMWEWNHANPIALYNLILTQKYCTACKDCGSICCHCKLGNGTNCTPRRWYADQYFSIVRNWVSKKTKTIV